LGTSSVATESFFGHMKIAERHHLTTCLNTPVQPLLRNRSKETASFQVLRLRGATFDPLLHLLPQVQQRHPGLFTCA
jgi:hypothetical protein